MRKGSTIGIVAPAGPLKNSTLKEISDALNKLGYKVVFSNSCYSSYKGYLSARDYDRAKDIEQMFLNDNVDCILCLRGGYGTMRILDKIDYSIVMNNPKPFIGFSDITALHIAFKQKANLDTYHGIMAHTSATWDDFSLKSLIDAINFEEDLYLKNPNDIPFKTLFNGICEGELVGGNLALIASTLGTEYEIDTKGKILFLEDIGESIYRLDRMFTQLLLAGKFNDCVGIILGDFADCEKSSEEDFSLLELFQDRLEKLNKPCLFNIQSGHCTPMITLPLGKICVLDATNKTIKIKQP